MSANVTDLAVTQFSANLEMKVQQTESRLRGKVAEGQHKGRQASPVQYISPVKMQTPSGRYAPLVPINANFERRWVFPHDRDLPQIIDTFDELRLISDPKSAYSTEAAAAVNREYDDTLIASAFADAKLGRDVDGFSTETFDTATYGVANTYGAGATSTGLTVAKLIEAKRKLRHYGADGGDFKEGLGLIVGSQQEADLLGQAQVTSSDFNPGAVLKEGSVTRFMGFDIFVSERLITTATNVRSCIAFMKSGLYLGVWQDLVSAATQREDLSSRPWQLYVHMTCGATRLQKGKLLTVDCADSVGFSIVP